MKDFGYRWRSKRDAENGKMRLEPHRFAFTLIELLVVIAVIALLLSILVPALSIARERARRVVCMGNIRQFTLGIQIYSNDYKEYLPT